MARVDETKIVDRDDETDAFARILGLDSSRRVLVVGERSGNGLTDLLRKIRLQCERDHDVPVALLDLEDFTSRPEEFAIIARLHRAYKESGASLPNFEGLNQARALKNTVGFLQHFHSLGGAVDMRNAAVTGAAKIAAMMVNVEHAENVNLPPWSDETDSEARALCVEAFLTDLTTYATEHRIVLLIDHLYKPDISDHLRRWVISELIKRQATVEWRRRRLVVVVAGGESREMISGRIPAAQQVCLHPITEFGQWDLPQVKAFLEANRLGDLDDQKVEAMHSLLRSGMTLKAVLAVAETVKRLGSVTI